MKPMFFFSQKFPLTQLSQTAKIRLHHLRTFLKVCHELYQCLSNLPWILRCQDPTPSGYLERKHGCSKWESYRAAAWSMLCLGSPGFPCSNGRLKRQMTCWSKPNSGTTTFLVADLVSVLTRVLVNAEGPKTMSFPDWARKPYLSTAQITFTNIGRSMMIHTEKCDWIYIYGPFEPLSLHHVFFWEKDPWDLCSWERWGIPGGAAAENPFLACPQMEIVQPKVGWVFHRSLLLHQSCSNFTPVKNICRRVRSDDSFSEKT